MNPRGERSPGDRMCSIKVLINGRVQGVWFRGWTVENARELGLDGWVRNLSDGSVEAVFSGAPDKVEEMLRRCEHGPPHARVSDIESVSHTHAVEPGFAVRR